MSAPKIHFWSQMFSRYIVNQSGLGWAHNSGSETPAVNNWLYFLPKEMWFYLFTRPQIQHKIQKRANCNCKMLVFLQEDASQFYLWNANTCVYGALKF